MYAEVILAYFGENLILKVCFLFNVRCSQNVNTSKEACDGLWAEERKDLDGTGSRMRSEGVGASRFTKRGPAAAFHAFLTALVRMYQRDESAKRLTMPTAAG